MLDIGSMELLLVVILGIIILGPTQIKSMAKFLGKMKRKLNQLTTDVRSSVEDNDELKEIKDAFTEIKDVATDTKDNVESDLDSFNREANELSEELDDIYRKK